MKFHKGIRKIHLIASMIMISFMLIYVLTGIIMINRNLFEIPPVEQSKYTVPVKEKLEGDVRGVLIGVEELATLVK